MRSGRFSRAGHRAALLVSLSAFLLAPRPSPAQLAPTGGHYAARPSDTGFAGAAASPASYPATVPLDLPPSRGGLPLPVAIVHGGRRTGAAGLSWDVPLSFILRDTSIAHRRPLPNPDAPPAAREQLSLTLDGQRIDLVPSLDGTAWVARRDDPQLAVRATADGWVAYDGQGRTYAFSTLASPALATAKLWLLTDVSGVGGSRVHLDYAISGPSPARAGLAIDLARMSYNPRQTTAGCYKNEVVLRYEPDPPPVGETPPTPISIEILGGNALVRLHKLTAIDVTSRAACGDAPVALRTYQLAYQADPDTGEAELRAVTMLGQEGTPERSVTLPVAAYAYGTATGANGGLTYRRTQRIPLPQGVDPRSIASSFADPAAVPPPAPEYSQTNGRVTLQGLFDTDGDGRPDLVYRQNGHLFAAVNNPGFGSGGTGGNGGPVQFLGLTQLTGLPGSPLADGPLEERSSDKGRTPLPGGYVWNTDMVWRQAIDVNGDGRLDVVDAKEEAGSWVVYLNTPSSPGAPSTPKWVRRTISIAPLVARLRAAGFTVSADYLPLSERKTGSTVEHRSCWQWVVDAGNPQGHWVHSSEGYALGICVGPPDSVSSVRSENTYVEWELLDVNGDGYPDFLFDSSPVVYVNDDGTPIYTGTPPQPGDFGRGTRTESLRLGGVTSQVMAMLDVAGAGIGERTSAFAAPVAITPPSFCSVERWEDSTETCGFADLNGDGLADWGIYLNTGNLNTGSPAGSFFTVPDGGLPGLKVASFPGFAIHSVPQYQICDRTPPAPTVTYTSSTRATLRDMNGDGIPDYVSIDAGGIARVFFGTGTRFGDAHPIDVPNARFALSEETEDCGGSRSDTTSGLYDVDGDGQPEVVVLDGNGPSLDVYQLEPAPEQPGVGPVASRPMAGRLVGIDNGYGATTTIGYRSAKEVGLIHLVPFPEVVVAAVGLADAVGSPLETPTLFAYGRSGLEFDPAFDAWVFRGYRSTVELRITSEQVVPPPTDGVATITETYPLGPFDPTMDAAARFRRYMTAGRVEDVTVLAGSVGRDPWALLDVDTASDPRRIGGTHYDWDARLLATGPTTAPIAFCIDFEYPYDYDASVLDALFHLGPDQCNEHGFAIQTAVDSWRGQPGAAPPATGNVHVRTEVPAESVDDLGRVGTVRRLNDVSRDDDDLVVTTTYATPAGTDARVLDAVEEVDVAAGLSGGPTLASERWEYDARPGGDPSPKTVSAGLVTAHFVSRLDARTGASIPDEASREIRLFDATYDAAGNPRTVTTTREDGATRKATTDYDPFSLAPVAVRIEATNGDGTALPALATTIARDGLTLAALSVTDPNGTASGATFDGFGRPLLATVTPPGGAAGVLESTRYLGFAVGEPGGRSVERTELADPVAPGDLATAAGRKATTFLDALGRATATQIALGADYANQTLVVGQRVYDKLGRVQYEADPFVANDPANDHYGTTRYFNVDGSPSCFIRGKGFQPFLATTDEASERYPTCFDRVFLEHAERVSTIGPDAKLAGSPQSSVMRSTFLSAIGRSIQTVTYVAKGVSLERATFAYDPLGNLSAMTRYLDPTPVSPTDLSAGSSPVATTWRYDSLGQVIELDEPESAAQQRSYSRWGELTATSWCDPALAALGSPCADRRTVAAYDALSRLVHREDRTDGAVDLETAADFTYDRPATFVGRVEPANVLGRLASASWASARAVFSYDALGRLAARGYDDRQGGSYVETHAYHGDGTPSELHLFLPDAGFRDERVDYEYDSAGRTRSVAYSDGATIQKLFSAPGAADLDAFGRLRRANYGPATLTAAYAAGGRRLLASVKVASPPPSTTSREIDFPALPGTDAAVTAFDPLGRERTRVEVKDGVAAPPTVDAYDETGRLVSAATWDAGSRTAVGGFKYAYDPLGNALLEVDSTSSAHARSAGFLHSSNDRDRICRVAYAGGVLDGDCNLRYDGTGNVVEMPTRANGTRRLAWLASGQVRSIADDAGNAATFGYDAFGAVDALTVTSRGSTDTRRDRRFGPLIARRDETAGGKVQSVLTRQIPGPGGLVATRHGAAGAWVFAFGERRGSRFATDQTGAFVQDVAYQPYGEAASTGAQPGSPLYTSAQWNGGDLLAAFGLAQLGARIYDPAIGRFLSRDPLLVPRTASTTNPYAFALDDPQNVADPSGLGCGPEDPGCIPPPPIYGPGGGGGGGGSCPACNVNHHQPPKGHPVYGPVVPESRWGQIAPPTPTDAAGRDVLRNWDGGLFHPPGDGEGADSQGAGSGGGDGPETPRDTFDSTRGRRIALSTLSWATRLAVVGVGIWGVAAESSVGPGILAAGARDIALDTAHGLVASLGDNAHLLYLDGVAESSWVPRVNSVGGLVIESTTPVSGSPLHVEGIVEAATRRGEQVTIYSGFHNTPTGAPVGTEGSRDVGRPEGQLPSGSITTPHLPFFEADKAYYSRYPNVTVIDASGWPDARKIEAIDTTPGVVIVNTCWGACLR